jgi:soluble lytic murein transglycosylase-like protein
VVHSAGSNGAANPFASYSVNSSLPVADQNLSSLIDAAARKYNVDPKLVSAVAEVESGGDQDAASSAGAVGVMQLMPDTAAALGVNPYDKKSNIEGGAKYLRQMLDAFDGDVRRAVAAYNAGPQAVKDYGGVPPYQETQNYVNKVLDIYR